MKHTQGFTIIELTIALLITSIVAGMMYRSFEHTQKTVKLIDALMNYTLDIPTVYNQMDKDISTVFVPERAFKELAEKDKKKNDTTQNNQTAPDQKQPEGEKEKKLEPLKNIFHLTSKDNNLESLSFVSTHSLSLYNSVVPNNVRVMYRLLPQQNGRYRLTRQETIKLGTSLKDFTGDKIRSYDLLTEIGSLSVVVFVPEKLEIPKKDEKKDQQSEQKEQVKKRVYKELQQWQFDVGTTEGEKQQDYLVPAYVQLTGTVVDPVTSREKKFVWEFKVMAFDAVESRLKEIKTQKDKKKQTQTGQQVNQQNGIQPPNPGPGKGGRP